MRLAHDVPLPGKLASRWQINAKNTGSQLKHVRRSKSSIRRKMYVAIQFFSYISRVCLLYTPHVYLLCMYLLSISYVPPYVPHICLLCTPYCVPPVTSSGTQGIVWCLSICPWGLGWHRAAHNIVNQGIVHRTCHPWRKKLTKLH